MTLLLGIGASALATGLAWPLSRLMGRQAGWPLAILYIAGFAALVPEARTVFSGGTGSTASIPWVPARGWDAVFIAEPIGIFFALITLGIGAIVLVYSTAYFDKTAPAEAGTIPAHTEPPPGTPLAKAPGYAFYQLIAVFTFGMLLLVLTDSLAVLYVGWELTSLASFALILTSGRPAFASAMRTLSATFAGGLALLAAIALVWMYSGTDRISEALAGPMWSDEPQIAALIAVLVAVAVFSKSAQWPFHYWLPGAMAAATPVSAYLHAAAVVKAGIFLAMRFSPAFADISLWRTLLISFGLGTAIMAAIFALQKFDLKQLMAYSTVSQLGWIIAAIGVGTDAALAAAALHTLAHALFKSGLFMLIGVVDHATHTRDIRELRRIPGRIRKLPVAFVATLVGAAGMAGIPPLLGFVSKESMLTAFSSLDDGGGRWIVLAAATVGAIGTFAYCARIVLAAFVDEDRSTSKAPEGAAASIHKVSPVLLWAAAIPALVGLPLAFWMAPLDGFLDAFAAAAIPGSHYHSHLALWHGFGIEIAITSVVIVVGALLAWWRRPIERALNRPLLPFDGAGASDALDREVTLAGAALAKLTDSDSPARHVGALLATMCGLAVIGLLAMFGSGGPAMLPPLQPNLSRVSDVVLLLAIVVAVIGMCVTRSRVATVVLLSAVGISVTVQMFSLGAPDVGLTQLMVEAITVIVFLLVLRRLPTHFRRPSRGRHSAGLVMAALVGVGATVGTLVLTSRRERSDLGEYLLANTEEISGGHNVVNVILVEFRALDTFGELSVLGMAGIAIAAVIASMRGRYLDPGDSLETPFTELEGRPERVRRAFGDVRRNTVPLRLVVWFAAPVLMAVAALLFWRGHSKPGGGFIAALVASAAVALIYLSRDTDRPLTRQNTPSVVIGIGLLLAGGTGVAGYLWGTFLEPRHWEIAGIALSSSLVFDLGVSFAVLGLVMLTINLLGMGRLRPNGEEPARESESTAPDDDRPEEATRPRDTEKEAAE